MKKRNGLQSITINAYDYPMLAIHCNSFIIDLANFFLFFKCLYVKLLTQKFHTIFKV